MDPKEKILFSSLICYLKKGSQVKPRDYIEQVLLKQSSTRTAVSWQVCNILANTAIILPTSQLLKNYM